MLSLAFITSSFNVYNVYPSPAPSFFLMFPLLLKEKELIFIFYLAQREQVVLMHNVGLYTNDDSTHGLFPNTDHGVIKSFIKATSE